jgi:hypothetical protein
LLNLFPGLLLLRDVLFCLCEYAMIIMIWCSFLLLCEQFLLVVVFLIVRFGG